MKCKRHVFPPSKESLQTIGASAIGLIPDDPNLLDWSRSYFQNHNIRISIDLDIMKEKVAVNSNVLELGSIPLIFTVALKKSNYNVTGCDMEPDRFKTAIKRTGIRVVKCNIETEKLPFEGNSFDAVVFNELFEHLRINPIFTLSEVLRVIKPRGVLMLSTPNLKSLMGIFNFLMRNRAYSCSGDLFSEYKKLERLGHMGHVREYTTREIRSFLESIGFVVSELIFRGTYESSLKRLIIRFIPKLSPFVSYIATKP